MFPYPANPQDWQNGYTRQNAYTDSLRRFGRFLFPIAALWAIATLYIIIRQRSYLLLEIENAGWVELLVTFLLLALPLIFVIVAFAILHRVSGTFLMALYKPPSDTNPTRLVRQRLFGVPPWPPPLSAIFRPIYTLIKDGKVERNPWVQWLGGPALMIIMDGNAVYLERGNRFSRVVGAGKDIPFLELYETVKEVVDLRPQVRPGDIRAWTKDGIQVKMHVRIECRILPTTFEEGQADLLFPYDRQAVRRAVERKASRFDQQKQKWVNSDWRDGVWGQVQGLLANYVAGRYLDELFVVDKRPEKILPLESPEPSLQVPHIDRRPDQILSPDVSERLLQELNARARDYGASVSNLQITKVEFPEQVNLQRLDIWKAPRQRIATLAKAEATAFEIRARERAVAQVQQDMIVAIAKGLENVDPARFPEAVLLSLSGFLDQSLSDPFTRTYLARETLMTLDKIKAIL